ncbi:hydrogen gas-evolving membrane-bound hydrogenase subunit E [Carboxylicivirga sp. RSCT41]|uniref:hydrogen gas-evolving membrane-bound hydrogenase subunit E n=1 Tax=Carboxylicivirga agarovorans TaxID=3417570 RepID=UPI003D344684
MLIILILYLVLAFALFLIPAKLSKYNSLLIAVFHLSLFSFFITHLPDVAAGNSINIQREWIPQLGLNFELRLDGLSMVFALLITFIGFLVFIYAGTYMKSYTGTIKFYFYLTLFSGAMLGLVLSADFIQLFMFWELTSVLSFMLISYFNENVQARKAAFQSLFVTGFGGLCLFAAIILIGSIVDSYSLSVWMEQAHVIKADNRYLPALILILTGIFTKSAQFPFHFWLLGAMQAPTPVSAFLHSATMVKAGVFLLARLYPVLGGTPEWTQIVPLFGALTMLTGSYLAITQIDIKLILAYTTISALGVLVLLLGIDTQQSVKAAMVFLFVHAFYKSALFMLAGYITKQTGTRSIDKIGGLIHSSPLAFVVALIALLSMAGLPPMLGFIGKELIYEAKFDSPWMSTILLVIGVTSNVFMVTIAFLFLFEVFLGHAREGARKPVGTYRFLLFSPGILALLSLGFGLFPDLLTELVGPALNIIRTDDVQIKLKLWHGLNQVFFLSAFTVLAGISLFIIIYKHKQVIKVWQRLNNRIFSINFTKVFSSGLDRFIAFSSRNTHMIQHGYNRFYIITIIAFTSVLLIFQLYFTRGWEIESTFTLLPFYISGLVLIIMMSVLMSALSKSSLFTIVAMAVTGYGISLIYLYYSAVDLAITQIIIETLMVVMFVLLLRRLPRFVKLSSRKTKIRDAFIALGFGVIMTLLALKAIHIDFNPSISDYFVENSALKAYGKNVVNVILVDFRALDTLGEITVLTIAALGVFTLLNVKKTKK